MQTHAKERGNMKKVVTVFAVIVLIGATLFVFNKRTESLGESQAKAAWNAIKSDTTAAPIELFLSKYPNSALAEQARARLDGLRMEQAWEKTLAAGSLDALLQFTAGFPSSPYIIQADSLMERFQAEKDWLETQHINTNEAYQNFIIKHPETNFSAKAESTLIAMEVTGILSKEHSTLPSPQRLTATGANVSSIEIENQTRYTLTVRYSGKDSKRLTVRAHDKMSIVLANGGYRVAASVSASNVAPFAGNQVFEGGEYSSRYFIRGQ
jgi:hypothetical protein